MCGYRMWYYKIVSLNPFDFPNFYLLGGSVAIAALSALFLLSFFTPWVKRRRADLLRTEVVYDPSTDNQKRFTNLLKDASNVRPAYTPSEVYLSVVVPAMNEEERLPIMMDECMDYLTKREKEKGLSYEVLIVDDGSRDRTAEIGANYSEKFSGKVKVLKLDVNRGKGGAVRAGVMHSAGKLILFVDADGATKFSDFEKLEDEMYRISASKPIDESFPGIVVGSRAHLEDESRAERSFARTILMHGFHALVWIFTVRTVRDTQCGFKLFTRASAARLFSVLHIERWAFDVELLYLAEKLKLSIAEVCVTWHEVDGSKITPVWSWLQMGRDLILVWFRYRVGIWNEQVPTD